MLIILLANIEEVLIMSKKKNQLNKKYNEYVSKVEPKPKYFANCVKAFFIGGIVCTLGFIVQKWIQSAGSDQKTASTIVTILLIFSAQFLTGLGVFDQLVKFAGAGLIVPITGFANSIVAPAMEYKREGPVLGTGAKLFSLAGPVLVCGFSAAVIIGVIYAIIDMI